MKLNEITNPHAEIEALLDRYKIENYTIRPDGTVDIDGDVDFFESTITRFPVNFGKVSGNFNCSECTDLTTLQGAPSQVDGSFNCGGCTNMKSLVGGPLMVGEWFNCSHCDKLNSIIGLPTSIGSYLGMGSSPKITSLVDFHTSVGTKIYCNWRYIKTGGLGLMLSGATTLSDSWGPFKIIQQYLKRPDDIFECQTELIEAGYEAFAQL